MAWTTAGVCPYWLANWTVVRNGPSQPAATLLSRFCNRGERRMNDRSIGVDAAVAPTSVPAARGATAEPCGTRTMVVREWGCAAAAATPTVIDMRTAPTASSGTNRRVLGEGRDADIRADPFGQVGVGTTRSCRRSAGRNLDPTGRDPNGGLWLRSGARADGAAPVQPGLGCQRHPPVAARAGSRQDPLGLGPEDKGIRRDRLPAIGARDGRQLDTEHDRSVGRSC
jgi:hypothetical protein